MISTLIFLLIVALLVFCVYLVLGKFLPGDIMQIIGIILGLVFLLYVLRTFNVL
jgi:hypothetical protein